MGKTQHGVPDGDPRMEPEEGRDAGFEFSVPVANRGSRGTGRGGGKERAPGSVCTEIFLGVFGFFAVATGGVIFRISPEMLLRASLSCLGSKAVPGGFQLE